MDYPNGEIDLALFQWDETRTSNKLKLNDEKLQVIAIDGSGFKSTIGDYQFTPGYKYYYELRIIKGSLIKIGVCTINGLYQDQAFCDNDQGWAIYNGELRHNSNSTGQKYGKQYKTNDIIGVMLDMIDGQLSFTINGENQGIAFEGNEFKQQGLYAAIAPIYKDDGIELVMAIRED